jgi:hypothetical protein
MPTIDQNIATFVNKYTEHHSNNPDAPVDLFNDSLRVGGITLASFFMYLEADDKQKTDEAFRNAGLGKVSDEFVNVPTLLADAHVKSYADYFRAHYEAASKNRYEGTKTPIDLADNIKVDGRTIKEFYDQSGSVEIKNEIIAGLATAGVKNNEVPDLTKAALSLGGNSSAGFIRDVREEALKATLKTITTNK